VPLLPFPIVLFILPVLFVNTLVPGMLSVLKDLKLPFGSTHGLSLGGMTIRELRHEARP